ncbi:hypothetical protein FGG08_004460 [Glutinoglossum americanum]|uniref:Uncharacterized protein n=1 Tax=Glutinoglossum americanum TaxID=1670608 RepID=A0A9P8IBA5_9PEZI|nr:hypothetical protein FGG08_004460 [Glutinoglossum americanum]
MSRSPSGRSSTLPPIRHREKISRPRKPSVTEGGRKAKHEKNSSRGHGRRMSYDGRKAYSAEPSTAANLFGNRWEDLIDAATTATKEADDPVPSASAVSAIRASTYSWASRGDVEHVLYVGLWEEDSSHFSWS